MLLREERGSQFPYPSVFESTGTKTDHLKDEGQSYPHSMTCNLLDKERNPGYLSILTRWNGGRRKKSNDWPRDPYRQNVIFS